MDANKTYRVKDENYIRMLRAILRKSIKQHFTKERLYGYLPTISQATQVRRTRHAGQYWRSKDQVIGDVLLWTPTYGRTSLCWSASTYTYPICADTRCNLKGLRGWLETDSESESERERERERESQESPCWLCDLMMIMMMMELLFCWVMLN